jgi:hypothetical protein
MMSAVLEAIFGLVLLVLFLAKFLKIGPLLRVNEVWKSLGSKANFINKWWFNLIFIGLAIALISAPLTESKASKLGVDRSEYSKLEADGRLYGMTAEQFYEEGKKAKELKFEKTSTYLDAKKYGLLNPVEYNYALKLGRTLKEWSKDKEEIAKSGQSMEQYVNSVYKNMAWATDFEKNLSKASAENFREFKNTVTGLAKDRLTREEETAQKENEKSREILKSNAINKNISNRECQYLGVKQAASESFYCYADVGYKISNDASTVAYRVQIDAKNFGMLGDIYPEDKFRINGVVRKVLFGSETTRWNSQPFVAGDAVIEIEGRVERK